MRKAPLAVAALMLLTLAACGSQNGTETPPNAPGAGAETGGSIPQPSTAPTVLLKTTSSGSKSLTSFTTGDRWNLQYSYNCTNASGTAAFTVTDDSGKSLLDIAKTEGSGSTEESTTGTHHLQVTSGCDWTVAVTE